jgi:threonyl-tRNA synthetase
LSPEQVMVIPINSDCHEYAKEIEVQLQEAGVRVINNDKDEMMQAKIRDAQELKIPYMLVVGKREQEQRSVSLRYRDRKENVVMKFDDFKANIVENIKSKNKDIHFE